MTTRHDHLLHVARIEYNARPHYRLTCHHDSNDSRWEITNELGVPHNEQTCWLAAWFAWCERSDATGDMVDRLVDPVFPLPVRPSGQFSLDLGGWLVDARDNDAAPLTVPDSTMHPVVAAATDSEQMRRAEIELERCAESLRRAADDVRDAALALGSAAAHAFAHDVAGDIEDIASTVDHVRAALYDRGLELEAAQL